jgi:hypothetical protein
MGEVQAREKARHGIGQVWKRARSERGPGMEEGQARRRARHGRGPGMDEGPCMMEASTDTGEGHAREERQASVAWKAIDRFLHE